MATTGYSLTETWVEVGTGPLLVETTSNFDVRLYTGSSAPQVDHDVYHYLGSFSSFYYPGTDKVYVRAGSTSESSVVVTY